MTSLLFERPPRVYLPEIPAYKDYLARHHPEVRCFESTPEIPLDPAGFDIVWRFMGLDMKGRGNFVVHEYNSLSTAPAARLKNLLKTHLNARPAARVFLSPAVREGFSCRDDVPFKFRDMGVDEAFFQEPESPEYDFVYAGSLDRGIRLIRLLDRFTGPMKEHSILLLGDAPAAMAARYKSRGNIVFAGRQEYGDVPGLMRKSRFGLNIMPDCYPLNRQTATKVLEYCALGLPVVSSPYGWIEEFARQRGGSFFWLDENAENLSPETVENFKFKTPDVSDLTWDAVIRNSGVFGILKT